MNKYLKSRGVWTGIALFVINGFPAIRNLVPPAYLPVIDAILGLLAVYFRTNPIQKF